jgi:folate-binding protein YgfZ
MTSFCVPLKNRGVLSLQGEDRYRLLQGLMTNDINRIKESGILFTALLSPQGRFLHDFFIIERGDTLYVTPERERLADLLALLQRYKLRASVQIQDESTTMGVFAAWGGLCPPLFMPDPRLREMGYLGLFSVAYFPEEKGNFEDYDRHRILLGVPEGSRDLVVDKAIILENNYHELHAMDWEKGCYVGQELMARTHHRGLVRKRLMPVKIEGSAPAVGTPIMDAGEKVGTMKSSVGDRGLALLQMERATQVMQEGRPFEAEDALLWPFLPTFL